MSTRCHQLTHRTPRGPRRVAVLMLLVQLLLLLATAWPGPTPARAGGAEAGAGLWVVVCSPQGMKQVLLSSLPGQEDSQPAPSDELMVRGGHCLLCQQQHHGPALPMPAPALLLPALAIAAPPPDWQPQPPRAAAPAWRPLLARAPPLNA